MTNFTTLLYILLGFANATFTFQTSFWFRKHTSYPLIDAAASGNLHQVQLLISQQAEVDQREHKVNRTPLHTALLYGYEQIAEQLISSKADPNLSSTWCETPLILAARQGLDNIVVRLILAKAVINKEIEGLHGSALHQAAMNGHASTVEKLIKLKAGVLINAMDESGKAPIHYAAQNGHSGVMEKLLSLKAKADAKTKDNESLLHLAAENGHTTTVEKLVALKLPVDSQTIWGRTALHRAALRGYGEVVQKLIEAAADVNMKDQWKTTPLALAIENHKGLAAEKLLAAKASMHLSKEFRRTLIHLGPNNYVAKTYHNGRNQKQIIYAN